MSYSIKNLSTGMISEYTFEDINDAKYYAEMLAKVDAINGHKSNERVIIELDSIYSVEELASER